MRVYQIRRYSHNIFVVPGPVLNLSSNTQFTFINLTWAPPADPNGIILGYEVNYRVTDRLAMNIARTTMYTISDLAPGTRVSISVSAYTNAGRGAPILTNQITHTGIYELKD